MGALPSEGAKVILLYRPVSPGLDKKSRDFCGLDDLSFLGSSLFFRGK